MSNFVANYVTESFRELAKVTWPTRTRALNICILVVGFVAIAAAVIAGIDFLFHAGYGYLLSLSQ